MKSRYFSGESDWFEKSGVKLNAMCDKLSKSDFWFQLFEGSRILGFERFAVFHVAILTCNLI